MASPLFGVVAPVADCFIVYLWSCCWTRRGLSSSAAGRSRCSSRSPRVSAHFWAELHRGLATFLLTGRDRSEPSADSVSAAAGEYKLYLPVFRLRGGPIAPTAAGFRLYPWPSCAPDSCRFRTSSPRVCSPRQTHNSCTHDSQIAYKRRWLTRWLNRVPVALHTERSGYDWKWNSIKNITHGPQWSF